MISLSSIGPFLSFAISLIISVIILLSDWKSRLNRTFFTLGAASCVYSLAQALCRNASAAQDVLFWSRISFTGAVLLPLIVMRFCREFFDAGTIRSIYITPLYPSTLIMLYLNFTPAMFREVDFTYGEPVVRAGWAMTVNSLIILATIGYLMARFRHDFIGSEDPDHRNRLKYLALGAALYLLAGGLDVLRRFDVLYLFTVPVADYATMLFMFLLAYTIRRHKLLEIRTFISKSIAVSAVMASLAVLFIILEEGLEFLISSLLAPGTQSIWPGVMAAMTIAVLFYPLRKVLDRRLAGLCGAQSGAQSGEKGWWRGELPMPEPEELSQEDRSKLMGLASALRKIARACDRLRKSRTPKNRAGK